MKIILYLALICVCVAVTGRAHAQGPMTVSKVTLTNTDTSYLTAQPAGGNFVALQLNVVKVSGTVGGAALVQCSEDGLNWSSATDTAHAVVASYTVTDGTQTKRWELGEQRTRRYRVRVTTTGTQVSTVGGFYWVNK